MVMSVGGLGSGIDTNSIVAQLMSVERKPLVKMNAQVSNLDSIKKIWMEINTKLQNLNNAIDDLSLDTSLLGKTATSSDEKVLTATATTTATNGTYDVNITQIAKAHMISSNATGLDTSIATGTLSLKVGSQATTIDISLDSSVDTLETVRDKINQKVSDLQKTDSSFIGVSATLIDGKLVLQSEKTGTTNAISIAADDFSLFSGANYNELQAAQDAKFSVNGISVTRTSNTVSDVIDGVTLTIKSAGTSTLTITNDTSKGIEKIKKFVEEYNAAYDYINNQQKVGDKDKTAGTLKGDYSVSMVVPKLWEKVTRNINNGLAYDQIHDIGIQTEGSSGKLVIDETKLKTALETDPDAVNKLFFSDDPAASPAIGDDLKNYIDSYIASGTGIIDSRQEILDDQIRILKDQIASFELRMEKRESTLRNQFLAMEKALATLNSQSSWLAGQIASLPTYE
jgi:flagellar hook-associated protein 2